MRWTSLYFGFMAGVLGFAASVTWVAEAPAFVPLSLLGLAAAFGATMFIRARHEPKVLLVGRTGHEPLYPIAGAIDDAGYAIISCPGPSNRPCPVLEGKPCPITTNVLGTIAVRFTGTTPPCERALGVPLVALDPEQMGDARRAVAELGNRMN